MLTQVVGFDTVDDESIREKVVSLTNYKEVVPEDWNVVDNPPYSYWSYYIYSNLVVLNHIRKSKGLNTIAFRPHCGEAGVSDHLAVAFLTAHSINHGIEMRKSPVLQYLFYLRQIGLAMSPLSNNKLFLEYVKNPFIKYFNRGLNVSLSTDDPLMIHLTKEPLLEEYSVAA
jgi:AMP deaminase